ncbi:hypothetical protein DFR31_1750 [Alkalispirillum mobile]|uniref:AEC family transporter n=1 Tax=Alkalispirillum mobile TaxID=85925 RepID=A0A498C032_9GAMM|nr:AEC family transporter [Alkalispirillum mobile]RLK48643.1 hypothetical protein DFR31_1750 [Alkalispirillum mobile]
MGSTIAALISVFGLIALGHILYRTGFAADGFWPTAERLTYYLALPALLVARLSEAPLHTLDLLPIITVLIGAVLLIYLAQWALLRPSTPDGGPAFTSVLQGSMRPNTYVGLATAIALFGDKGLTLAAISLAVLVPLVNILAVIALMRYGKKGERGGNGFIGSIVRNPLVMACVVGILLNVLTPGLPGAALMFLDGLGQAALPLGLMAVGAGLYWGEIGRSPGALALASVLKLLVLPMVTAVGGWLMGLDETTLAVLVLFSAVPASASCYILARQLGGDAVLMATILTVQTALAVITLPLVLGLTLWLF